MMNECADAPIIFTHVILYPLYAITVAIKQV